MDDTRYERLEARISALEAEVRLITAESVRAQSPPSPTVTEPTVIDDPADARHVAGAPNVSPSSEKTRALEKTLGGRGLQFAGLLLILFGAAFFLDLAATRGWIGPAERILLGLAVGAGLMLFAARRVADIYRLFAESLIGLGAGILYLSLWASVSVFPELHVSRGAAFAAMIAVTALLGALAAARRSERIAFLGALGGYLTPVLLNGGQPDHVVLAVYVILLTGGMLALAERCAFTSIEILALLGAIAYAPAFAPDPSGHWPMISAQIVATLFFLVLALAYSCGSRNSTSRHVVLLAASTGCYVVILELLLSEHHTVLGYDLLALTAALLVAANVRKWPRALLQTYGGLGLGSLTLALAALLHGLVLIDAVTVEATVLAALGRRERPQNPWIAWSGMALFACAGSALVVEAALEPPARALQIAVGFGLWLAGAAFTLRLAPAPTSESRLDEPMNVCRVAVDAVAVVGLSRACLDLFGGPHWNVAVPSFAQFGISIVLTGYATALIGYGLWRRRSLLRWEGLVLFAGTICKVLAVDLSSVDLEYRIGSFVVLGVVLFAVSAWYTRSMAKATENARE
jgi:uncharacterized membrane protein